MYHVEKSIIIPAVPEQVFAFADNHENFSSHMSESSWMMGGGRVSVETDEGRGRRLGSHIRMSGTAFGLHVYLDEVITQYEPPHVKVWRTAYPPKLIVIGHYRMKLEIKPHPQGSACTVSIDYELPTTNVWLGKLLSKMYAKWCVNQMTGSLTQHFAH